MKKMAIFVEGFTELLFVEKLIEEIAGRGKVRIEKKQFGGRAGQRRLTTVGVTQVSDGQTHYFLIYDCRGYTSVASDIRDQYTSLVASGFSEILGMRDVHPNRRSDIPNIRRMMGHKLRTDPVSALHVLAIMETEAWFLAEHTHLLRIDATLTPEFVASELNFNPQTDDMEARDEPAKDLDAVYSLAGSRYKKGVRNTIDVLDYARVFLELPERIPDLAALVSAISNFMAA